MLKLLSVDPTPQSSNKKWTATFQDGDKTIRRSFGQKGADDFTITGDIAQKERYRARHRKDLKTNDPTRPGYLSYFILWNRKTVEASIRDFKRRLAKYNKTGDFPID